MATSTETHDAAQYVEFDEYISFQLQRTRSSVRLTDLLTAAVGAGSLAVVYLLIFVVLDHWVIPGGFSPIARISMLVALLVITAGWLGWKLVVPYMRRVNPLFAARLIEKSAPDLKGGLVTLVDLQRAGRDVPEEIRRAIEKRAAVMLSHVDVEHAVDRRRLMHLSYVLFLGVLLFCLYTVLSPKKPWSSLWRAILPAADLSVATRTEILRVLPGDVEVLARAQLEVTVDLRGEIPERTLLLYTTADRKFVDEPVEMRLADETTKQFRAMLTGENGRGILQNMSYRIVAGDAHSEDFHLTVLQPPSATIDSLHYVFPDYMELSPTTQAGGNIEAWEGATVSLSGHTNVPVRSAVLRFSDTEERNGKAEELVAKIEDGTKLSAQWKLAIRSDGSSPRSYHAQCRNEAGETDPEPIQYTVKIRPDAPPDVAMRHPAGDIEMPANGVVPLVVEARDPDFKLRRLKLQIEKSGEEIIGPEIYEGSEQSYSGSFDWRLTPLNLKAGDVLSFWIEAQDNKQPIANRKNTPKLRIRITDPVSKEQIEKQLAQEKQRQEESARQEGRKQQGDQLAANKQRPEQNKEQAAAPQNKGKEPSEQEKREREQVKRDEQKQANEKGHGDQSAGEKLRSDEKGEEQKPGSQEQLDPEKESDEQKALQKILDRQKERLREEGSQKEGKGTDEQQEKQRSQDEHDKQNNEEQGKSESGEDSQKGESGRGKQSGKQAAQDRNVQESHEAGKPGQNNEGSGNQQKEEPRKPGSQPEQKGNGSKEEAEAKKNERSESGADGKGERKDGAKDRPENERQNKRDASGNDQQRDGNSGDSREKKSEANDAARNEGSDADKSPKEGAKENGTTDGSDNEAPASPKKDPTKNSEGDSGTATKNENKSAAKNKPDEKRKNGEAGDENESAKEKGDPNADSKSAKDDVKSQDGTGKEGKQNDGKPQDGSKPGARDDREPSQGQKDGNPATNKSDGANPKKADPNNPNKNAAEKNSGDKQSDKQGDKQNGTPNTKQQTGADPDKNAPRETLENARRDRGAKDVPEDVNERKEPTENQPPGPPAAKSDQKEGDPSQPPDAKSKDGKGKDGEPSPDGKQGQQQQTPKQGGKESSKPGDKSGEGQKSEQKQQGAGTQKEQSGDPQNGDAKSGDANTPGEGKPSDKGNGKPGEAKQGGKPSDSADQSGAEGGKEGSSSQGKGTPSEKSSPGKSSAKGGKSGGGGQKSDNPDRGDGRGDGNDDGQGKQGAGTGQGEGNGTAQEADLEAAKKATNLVLRKIRDDMKRGEVDQKLLDELGWTENEMKKFLERMQNSLQPTDLDSPAARARQRQFEETLKSLNLKSSASRRSGEAIKKRATEEIGPRRTPTPAEYREYYEAFTRSLSKQENATPSGKKPSASNPK